jgi:hypothetical protein
MTINVDGHAFTYDQPRWWASCDDPEDADGQLTDEDNVIRAAARREASDRIYQRIYGAQAGQEHKRA